MSSVFERFFAATAPAAQITADGDAVLADAQPLPALLAHNTIVPLPYWSFLQVAGPDAAKFLQGQLTCDINTVTDAQASLGAHCTPKGRMQSSFLIARPTADTYWLRVRTDIGARAGAALGKYIVFSKAKITAPQPLLALGLHGPSAATAVAAFAGRTPNQLHGVVATSAGVIIQLDTEGQRFEAWLPEAEAIALWRQCNDFQPAGSAFWRWLDIRTRQAAIETGTIEAFIPQMLNYHENGGVSFTKGCYTGQEIVARTQYRGQVKRHLLRAEVEAAAPAAGSEVVGTDGRALGQVAAAVDRGDGYCELLIVVSVDKSAPPALYLRDATAAGGAQLQVL